MIISKLIGGLGNQMFQYAAGRALALRNQESLRLDISGFSYAAIDTPREYELAVFDINAEIATAPEILKLRGPDPGTIRHLALRALNRTVVRPDTYLPEEQSAATDYLSKVSGEHYLDGFWQSEHFFSDFSADIRQDFRFLPPASGENDRLLGEINQSSVSLHVRRGDYVSNAATNSIHGTCDPDYYQEAVLLLAKKVPDLSLYVFSDDPSWCQENLAFDRPTTYVSHNSGSSAWEDMRLMSACGHNVIANSSFSWWGAWLNPNPDKLVIAPKQWFRDQSKNSSDIVPAAWTRL